MIYSLLINIADRINFAQVIFRRVFRELSQSFRQMFRMFAHNLRITWKVIFLKISGNSLIIKAKKKCVPLDLSITAFKSTFHQAWYLMVGLLVSLPPQVFGH